MARTRTATASEVGARKLLRGVGLRVEAVPMVRQQSNEHSVIICWPATEVADVVLMLTDPRSVLDITRIHVGRETYPGQPPTARVYIGWKP